jgi:FtsP/CotA-like multicopper oxidase with cupredoxin domain
MTEVTHRWKRTFLKAAVGGAAGLFSVCTASVVQISSIPSGSTGEEEDGRADYTLHIAATPIEIAPKKIISAISYNGQFPGPLLRFKEGRTVTVDVFNDTDTPEQLHWHGQLIPTSVDGAAQEGAPFGNRRKHRLVSETSTDQRRRRRTNNQLATDHDFLLGQLPSEHAK